MSTIAISSGVVHDLPTDMRKVIESDESVRERWEDLTPLARNEWICWTITVKKEETRRQHIERMRTELLQGKRRPCCWIGCIHRPDKPMSKSVKWVIDKKSEIR